MRHFALAAALTLAAAGRTAAQTVGGQVQVAGSRQPLGGVVAGLVDPAGRWVAATRADTAGWFSVNAPRAGRYHVVLLPAAGRPYDGAAEVVSADTLIQHAYPVPDSTVDRTLYLPQEVTDSARFLPEPVQILYRRDAAERHMRGWVSLLIVVGPDGRVEPGTVQPLLASDPQFTAAVFDALPHARFTPARLDGAPVRQLRPLTVDFGFEQEPGRGEIVVRSGIVPYGGGPACPPMLPRHLCPAPGKRPGGG